LVRWTRHCGTLRQLVTDIQDGHSSGTRALISDACVPAVIEEALLLQTDPSASDDARALADSLHEWSMDILADISGEPHVVVSTVFSALIKIRTVVPDPSTAGHIVERSLAALGASPKRMLVCPLLAVCGASVQPGLNGDLIARCAEVAMTTSASEDPMMRCEAYLLLASCVRIGPPPENDAFNTYVTFAAQNHPTLIEERCSISLRGMLVLFLEAARRMPHAAAATLLCQLLEAHEVNTGPAVAPPAMHAALLDICDAVVEGDDWVNVAPHHRNETVRFISSLVGDPACGARATRSLLRVSNIIGIASPTKVPCDPVLNIAMEGAAWAMVSQDEPRGESALCVELLDAAASMVSRMDATCQDVTAAASIATCVAEHMATTADAAAQFHHLMLLFDAVLWTPLAASIDVLVAVTSGVRACAAAAGLEDAALLGFTLTWNLLLRCCTAIDAEEVAQRGVKFLPSTILADASYIDDVDATINKGANTAKASSDPTSGRSFYALLEEILATATVVARSATGELRRALQVQCAAVVVLVEIAACVLPKAAVAVAHELFQALFADATAIVAAGNHTPLQRRVRFVRHTIPILNRTLSFDLNVAGEPLFAFIEALCAADETAPSVDDSCYRAFDPEFALFRRLCDIVRDEKSYNRVRGPAVFRPMIAALTTVMRLAPDHPDVAKLGGSIFEDVSGNVASFKKASGCTTFDEAMTCFESQWISSLVDAPPCSWQEADWRRLLSCVKRLPPTLATSVLRSIDIDVGGAELWPHVASLLHAFVARADATLLFATLPQYDTPLACLIRCLCGVGSAAENVNSVLATDTSGAPRIPAAWLSIAAFRDSVAIAVADTSLVSLGGHSQHAKALLLRLATPTLDAEWHVPIDGEVSDVVLSAAADLCAATGYCVPTLTTAASFWGALSSVSWSGCAAPMVRPTVSDVAALTTACATAADVTACRLVLRSLKRVFVDDDASPCLLQLAASCRSAHRLALSANVVSGSPPHPEPRNLLHALSQRAHCGAALAALPFSALEEHADDLSLYDVGDAMRYMTTHDDLMLWLAALAHEDVSGLTPDCVPTTLQRTVLIAAAAVLSLPADEPALLEVAADIVSFLADVARAGGRDMPPAVRWALLTLCSWLRPRCVPHDDNGVPIAADTAPQQAIDSVVCTCVGVASTCDIVQRLMGAARHQRPWENSILLAAASCLPSLLLTERVLAAAVNPPCAARASAVLTELVAVSATFDTDTAQQLHAAFTPTLMTVDENADPDEARRAQQLCSAMLVRLSNERFTRSRPHFALSDFNAVLDDYPLSQMGGDSAAAITSVLSDASIDRAHRSSTAVLHLNMFRRGHCAMRCDAPCIDKPECDKLCTTIMHACVHATRRVVQSLGAACVLDTTFALQTMSILSASCPGLLKRTPMLETATAAVALLQDASAFFNAIMADCFTQDSGAPLGAVCGLPETSDSSAFLDISGMSALVCVLCAGLRPARPIDVIAPVDLPSVLTQLVTTDWLQLGIAQAFMLGQTNGLRKELIAEPFVKELSHTITVAANAPLALSCAALQALRSAFACALTMPDEESTADSCSTMWESIASSARWPGQRLPSFAHYALQCVINMQAGHSQWGDLRRSLLAAQPNTAAHPFALLFELQTVATQSAFVLRSAATGGTDSDADHLKSKVLDLRAQLRQQQEWSRCANAAAVMTLFLSRESLGDDELLFLTLNHFDFSDAAALGLSVVATELRGVDPSALIPRLTLVLDAAARHVVTEQHVWWLSVFLLTPVVYQVDRHVHRALERVLPRSAPTSRGMAISIARYLHRSVARKHTRMLLQIMLRQSPTAVFAPAVRLLQSTCESH
jgi:hypothetical protein